MRFTDLYSFLLIGLILSLIPLWIGYRRKISPIPMLLIMFIGGLIPYAGWIVSLYIACRAKSHLPKPEKAPSGASDT